MKLPKPMKGPRERAGGCRLYPGVGKREAHSVRSVSLTLFFRAE